jgi:hypothetical protein
MAINKLPRSGIADSAVTTAKVSDGVINVATEFPDCNIASTRLADCAVTNAKLSNSAITVRGTSTSLGGSLAVSPDVNWQSVVVSDGSTVTTMVAYQGFFVNNTSAAGIVKLPASAAIGDTIAIKDYAGNFATNNLTIQRNSHNIQGVAADVTVSTNRASLVLVYVDSTKGWLITNESNVADLAKHIEATGGTVTTSGDFKIHTFTGDGNFVVSQLGPDNTIDYLVLAGGGGGGNTPGEQAGGGGGGGLRSAKTGNHGSYTVHPNSSTTGVTISAATFPITVGGGGAAPGPSSSASGSNSVFSTITSAGGGRGGSGGPGDSAENGGSGGGGGWNQGRGNGNTPPVSPPQGGDGGRGNQGSVPSVRGGAGGGSGSGNDGSDLNVPGNAAGAGGAGATNHITGSPVVYGSGGGGGGLSNPTWNTSKGNGGTGAGNGADNGSAATSATANRGGGGGGASGAQAGSAGGSGVVIIRYKYQN